MSFAHLHVHSEYSLLDGFSNIKKLVKRVQEMGMNAVALTDHGTMFGAIEFYNAATAAGIKPVIGLEAYMAARTMEDRDPKLDKQSSHLLLLAQNETGYRNLLKIASTAQLKGFYYYPRIDHDFLARHAEGLIATSGCMAAEIPRTVMREGPEAARKKLDWYYDVFGKENFFIELQHHDIKELPELNRTLLSLGERYQANYIATNDVHYINPTDARLQDIMLAVQTGSLLKDENRFRMTDQSYYLRPPEEMQRLFAEVPEALANTQLIADRCNVDLGMKGYHLPVFPVPEGHTAETYLRMLCEEGLVRRYGARARDPEVRERLEYELSVIHKMGFDAYFLIVWDLCRYARSEGVWYNARGSAAGSLVAYTLEITLVEPMQHDLIFERFLNPGRVSMPDIDLDFRDDLRPKMLEYCAHKYGDDKVAQIITFGTLGARAALRDVGRVMDVPIPEVDRVAKLIPSVPGKTIDDALEEVPDLKAIYEQNERLRTLIDTARHMEGVVRNAGTHAAGVVIADQPVVEYIPLHRPTSGSEESPIKTVTQFEMSILESLGLLKVDFLGLATLTVMARACDLIRERHGVEYSLSNIPTDDEDTYAFLGKGHTAGVFQLEGTGMTRYLVQMKPKNLANVIAMVALYRPGPLEFIPTYIRRMHGEEAVSYQHPKLEPIFKETFGIPVYQEQIMRAAVDLAGYTMSESDDLRKAIAKKQKDKLHKHQEKFIHGCGERGIPEETAAAIFHDWEEFARYGFNKCLPGDTEVVDAATGRLVKVGELYQNPSLLRDTLTCDTETLRLKTGPVARVMQNGVKPVFRLTTGGGRSIRATANHPFYTPHGWRTLEELKPGDRIAAPRRIPVEGQAAWPEYEVIALGWLLSEGNLCHPHSVYFYNQDPCYLDDYIRAAEAFPNVRCTQALHKGSTSVYAGRIERGQAPGIFTWAENLGLLGKTATEKEIPAEVFALRNDQIALLISRMWQGDGHLNLKGRSLFYATSSERLASQLQHLLLRLGILSRIRSLTFPYKEGRKGFQVFITDNENLRRFALRIGKHFLHQEDRAILHNLVLSQRTPKAGSKDIVPLAVKPSVQAAKAQSGLTWSAIRAATGVAPREFSPTSTVTKSGFRLETIGRLAAFFDDPQLRRWSENDITWELVRAIEPAGEEMTYDLEVPGTHNFIANDLLVHNSHAADYGVIAVQTAYLKSHYTVEYMTALLSASKNDADKVAFYIADCRSMGIDILPPHLNHSGWDFTIEDQPDGKSAIRFGMGAVKNVGQGAVELLLQARTKGPFTSLNDLARRVDLRQVGRRALECLIKVGALDCFGGRQAMLDALERIVNVSTSHFRAEQAGQLSLFSGFVEAVEEINLPQAKEVDQRAMLAWEKELIGLYVSDHPLNPYVSALRAQISHFSGQLNEVGKREKVRVAGLLSRVRTHQTKDGKAMAFLTMEDMHGNLEMVVFPRTWEQVGGSLEVDQVYLVEGKVDNEGAEPKLLVDTIERAVLPDPAALAAAGAEPAPAPQRTAALREERREYAPHVDDYDSPPPPDDSWGPPEPAWMDEMPPSDAELGPPVPRPAEQPKRPLSKPVQPVRPAPVPAAAQAPVPGEPPSSQRAVQTPAQRVLGDEPLPLAAVEPAGIPASPPPAVVAAPVAVSPPAQPEPSPASREPAAEDGGFDLPPFIFSPTPAQAPSEEGEPRIVTVILRSTGNKAQDVRRLKGVHGILRSYPGKDRFAFHIFEMGRRYLFEFPNETTGICPELLGKLIKFAGEENVRVDPLKIQ